MPDASDSMPAELIDRAQWVVWKGDKVPYNARTHKPASSTNPATWSAFQDALRALTTGKYQGLGFVITADDPYVGIDLDDCIDSDGYLADWAAPIVNGLNSYTEVTPSGRGLHIWVKGDLPDGCQYINDGAHIEIYPNKRYFTMTGQLIEGVPSTIVAANGALHDLYARCTTPDLPNVAPAAIAPDEAYTAAALRGMLADLRASVEGHRNIDLNAKAYRLGKFVGHNLIDEQRAYDELFAAGTALGLKAHEVRSTIRSGLNAGRRDWQQLTPPEPRRITTSVPAAAPVVLASDRIADIFADEIGAHDLKHKRFPKQIWPVETILSPGVTLLAGPPKSGKSWLALQIGIEVARGGVVMGRFETNPGRVLYLDLESSQRRMRERLEDLLGMSAEWPAQFRLLEKFPAQPETTMLLRHWLERNRDARLIVVDILKKIRPPQVKNGSVYNEDYEAIQPLNALADEFQVAILVLHHINKIRNAESAMERISGSNGLSGATTNNMVLLKTGQDGDEFTLHLAGRDYDGTEDSLGLRWDREIVRHIYAGTAEAVTASHERKQVLACFQSDDDVLSLATIAAMIGKSKMLTWKLVRSCQTIGLIEKVSHGKYARVAGAVT